MTRGLDEIPAGAAVMVDANILIYAFVPQARFHESCRDLLDRGARGAINLHTIVAVAADALHRVLVLEVLAGGQVDRAAAAARLLKRLPDLVTRLPRFPSLV